MLVQREIPGPDTTVGAHGRASRGTATRHRPRRRSALSP
jgi:hypothetical protein